VWSGACYLCRYGDVQAPQPNGSGGAARELPDQLVVGSKQEYAVSLGKCDVTGLISCNAMAGGDGQGVGSQVEG
jgi:hypothetical protein